MSMLRLIAHSIDSLFNVIKKHDLLILNLIINDYTILPPTEY